MAKKEKSEKKKSTSMDELNAKDRVLTIILSILFIIILLGAFIIFIKLDIGGFGSKVMYPVFKDVPVVKKILPDVSDEVLIKANDYPYKNIEEAVNKIKDLEIERDKLKKDYDDISNKIVDKDAEIARLQEIEKKQKNFDKEVADFNKKVVYTENAPDVSEYISYYEKMDPENAKKLYKQAISDTKESSKVSELASTYAKMEPGSAAKALEALKNDIPLVCDILNSMGQKDRANIMNQMSVAFTASVTQKMSQSKK